ncbi:nicotinate (nicotinamide) nucleotide adenylyltransferase [Geothrix sp. 21YS21S-4]|uniref:nicotinate (nicotinamide) nucleotide adenylyltransferase n=1 Tax=Geothrix sp. 21YS21S-4 TaxID=3068889 RepID=UPI0027BA630F|nr:nicotinate (nicotinamide) nucleotide adenylyltransferase [Geothrix sp. 21YS21S-4]
MRRIGLLGGAFNPPHEGHLKLARLALAHLGLDELRFVPTAVSPHKPDPGGPDLQARLRLLDEALRAFDPACRVETLELERGGTSYTVDTLEALTARERDAAWILVMGSDQLPGLSAWRRAERIFELASVAVALRPGADTPALPAIAGLHPVAAWSGAPGELVPLPATELDLASSDLRLRLAQDPAHDPEGIPSQVMTAIRAENLYR